MAMLFEPSAHSPKMRWSRLEAWLLFDERLIRAAAGNENGNLPLLLPPLKKLESLPDPKSILIAALREASGLTGRRLARFNALAARARISDLASDFAPLRVLPSFQQLEASLIPIIARLSPVPALNSVKLDGE